MPADKSLETNQEIYIDYSPVGVNGCIDRTFTTRLADKAESQFYSAYESPLDTVDFLDTE